MLCTPQKIFFGCLNKDNFKGRTRGPYGEQESCIQGLGEEA
jgi:hypothetical protein